MFGFVGVSNRVHFIDVERDALYANANCRQVRADLDTKSIAIHPKKIGRIPEPNKSRLYSRFIHKILLFYKLKTGQ